ncbi:hypothetical protein [uncultured Pseudodesulfovibrio sp.]|uniref:hypothetical protein n=1 Tax=uncultured Pseudodesulfovibrio sp. TaxID=2035858 RepID=UPI0029C8CF4D|nr:hypothetical protein [uncultured Pseudodesulfovibrio sp.]
MRSFIKLLLPLLIVGALAACTTTSASSSKSEQPAAQNYQEPDYYLDFDDIMIPKEIDYQNDGSYKLDNSKFRASIMKFKGRVEIPELVQYFINNMTKDNWTLVSNNKASSVQFLTFEKYNKSCVIEIDDTFASSTTTIFAVEVKDAGDLKKK